jgi:hypothetical protein
VSLPADTIAWQPACSALGSVPQHVVSEEQLPPLDPVVVEVEPEPPVPVVVLHSERQLDSRHEARPSTSAWHCALALLWQALVQEVSLHMHALWHEE